MGDSLEFSELVNHHRDGYSLEQAFYTDPGIFDLDLEKVFYPNWILVGHESRIPDKGDYFLIDIGKESIIIVRENKGRINAFFNVCRHRGSRICLEHEGSRKTFVCPYHAWGYRLDGALYNARLMPENFDPSAYGLHTCHVRLIQGLIFINLSPEATPNIDAAANGLQPLLEFQGINHAKIAARHHYPTRANWKLVVENFLECYHCQPSHPEYCTVHPPEAVLAMGAGPNSGPEEAMEAYQPIHDAWLKRAEALGHPTEGGFYSCEDGQDWGVLRVPIQEGYDSETLDGKPASTLMGQLKDFDGGQTFFSFGSTSLLVAMNDFAVMIQFIPREALFTDVFFTWLVDKDAEAGTDYDLDRMVEMWDATTRQDKTITENNQAGVLSSRYQSGPYSRHEALVVDFISRYKKMII